MYGGAISKAKPGCEIGKVFSVYHHDNRPIPRLLAVRGPIAIVLIVAALILYAIKSCSEWSLTHIDEKTIERLPAWIYRHFGVFRFDAGARPHRLPGAIGWTFTAVNVLSAMAVPQRVFIICHKALP
jgi:hypothetical protein